MPSKDNDNDNHNDDDAFGFALFCAYHLGLDRQGKRRSMNVHDVARDFGLPTADIRDALERFGLTSERLMNLDFDLPAARLDIDVSPPGVDLPSIARMHWELLQQAPEKPRDWQAELSEDERENERVFGKRGNQS